MLHSFKVINFPPFFDELNLDFHSIKNITHTDHIFLDGSEKLVRNIGIFGLNDSGKTRFIKALYSLQCFILGTSFNRNQDLSRITFDSRKCTDFKITFSSQNHLYEYCLVVKESTILIESLYLRDTDKNIPLLSSRFGNIKIFNEDGSSAITNSLDYLKFKTYLSESNREIKCDSADINKGNYWNEHFTNVIQWFKKIVIITPGSNVEFWNNNKNELVQILKHFDTGIEAIEYVDVTDKAISEIEDFDINEQPCGVLSTSVISRDVLKPDKTSFEDYGYDLFTADFEGATKAYEVRFYHEGIAQPFDIFSESEGTLRLLVFHPLLFNEEEDVLFVIDELDRKLHPLASRELLRLFNSKKQRKQQVIFTTHESTLLSPEILRTDEVRFIIKDHHNHSTLNSFVGHENQIYALSEKDYLDGNYDAIFNKREV